MFWEVKKLDIITYMVACAVGLCLGTSLAGALYYGIRGLLPRKRVARTGRRAK